MKQPLFSKPIESLVVKTYNIISYIITELGMILWFKTDDKIQGTNKHAIRAANELSYAHSKHTFFQTPCQFRLLRRLSSCAAAFRYLLAGFLMEYCYFNGCKKKTKL